MENGNLNQLCKAVLDAMYVQQFKAFVPKFYLFIFLFEFCMPEQRTVVVKQIKQFYS